MSYTKKCLNKISLILTSFILICFYFIDYQVLLWKNPDDFYFSKVYSIQIPIKEITNLKSFCSIQENSQNIIQENTVNKQTQRQIIRENQNNPWRIQIPKLGLNVHIENSTTPKTLLKAVGHFEGTTKWNGNVCLAAHNRGYQCNFFQKIKQLKIGDAILYCTQKGKRIYKVQTNQVILETDWRYLEATEDNRITLVTCEENRKEYRRCVQAVQIAEHLK